MVFVIHLSSVKTANRFYQVHLQIEFFFVFVFVFVLLLLLLIILSGFSGLCNNTESLFDDHISPPNHWDTVGKVATVEVEEQETSVSWSLSLQCVCVCVCRCAHSLTACCRTWCPTLCGCWSRPTLQASAMPPCFSPFLSLSGRCCSSLTTRTACAGSSTWSVKLYSSS